MKGTVGTHLKNELGLIFAFTSSWSVRCITMIISALTQHAGDILCDLIILSSEMLPRTTGLLYNALRKIQSSARLSLLLTLK